MQNGHGFIREIILENFMSYEYARIPLKPGVNVICGPNGSGKSSILLGISVALGQSYTERSRKLSDLIRWGKDVGRVTLILDNSRRDGRRPIPKIKKDQILLTRVLRRDGRYWFEIDNRAVNRNDVMRMLNRLGVNPDNMLIIMHQNMAEQFIVLSPQEKLKMVEAAVGLEPYRRNVLEAQRKLSRILSQEESIGRLLESAEQTLNYWREQYDRYQQKKQLIIKRRFLERELAWARVSRIEDEISRLRVEIGKAEHELDGIDREIATSENRVEDLRRRLNDFKSEWRRLLEKRIKLERELAKTELKISITQNLLRDLHKWTSIYNDEVGMIRERLKSSRGFMGNPNHEIATLSIGMLSQALNSKIKSLEDSLKASESMITTLSTKTLTIQTSIEQLESKLERIYASIMDERINLAILKYRRDNIARRLRELNQNLKDAMAKLNEATRRAKEMGPRVVSLRSIDEIIDEMRMVDGRIAALADVSEDIEKMYESYSKLYLELKEKARMVAENREKALNEVKNRMERWRKVINDLITKVDIEYQRILSQVAATGSIHLVNEHDIEAAGIEILVGFKGAKPVPLNAYTQSGGERSTATMAFLLALQQHVKSPFRAVDEYDIHMDPRNREMIANILVSSLKRENVQYLVITPNQLFFEGKDVHIIMVQNIGGSSIIREAV